jgi:hypothetical protein
MQPIGPGKSNAKCDFGGSDGGKSTKGTIDPMSPYVGVASSSFQGGGTTAEFLACGVENMA